MSENSSIPLRTIRSFVIREGRFTAAQKKAFDDFWPTYGIELNKSETLRSEDYFSIQQPIILDIGFGSGESLISLAQQRSDLNFIGVEVYRPGIGAVLKKIADLQLLNVRLINADVLELLRNNIAEDFASGVMVWFPDPWPKKRHHKRRLVQSEFLHEIARVMQTEGILHLASDWHPYIEYMREHINKAKSFVEIQTTVNPLKLSRPSTRFEQRGIRLGQLPIDLFYQLKK